VVCVAHLAIRLEALIEAAKSNRYGHRDATMILVTFRHGLRAAEVCDMRWGQVSFDGATRPTSLETPVLQGR
jgi:integrase